MPLIAIDNVLLYDVISEHLGARATDPKTPGHELVRFADDVRDHAGIELTGVRLECDVYYSLSL